MTIVITDGFTLNPGDLDWSPLKELGNVQYYDTTVPGQVHERCLNASVIITNKTVIPGDVIKAAPHLGLIAVSATGYNNVDVKVCQEHGVVVCNVPEYGTFSVAQHTFALLLELMNHVGEHVRSTKRDEWANELWSYALAPVSELKDKVMGIVGFGRIGRQVAVIARAFGMKVIFHNRSRLHTDDADQVSMEELFRTSDVVSLHCPLTDANQRFVNRSLLSTMKKNAVLINTSRGGLIDEADLAAALSGGLLKAAALDVLTTEPPAAGHPLIHHPRCIVTPHNAWISFEARSRLMTVTIENVRQFLSGSPQHVVSAK